MCFLYFITSLQPEAPDSPIDSPIDDEVQSVA